MTHAEYYRELTMLLRGRGLDDSRIAPVLQEIQDLSHESGQTPLEAFGSPREYAKKFPDQLGKTAKITGSAGRRLFMTTLYLLTAINAVNLYYLLSDRGVNNLLLLLGSAVILFFVSMIGAQLDRRLPGTFAADREAS